MSDGKAHTLAPVGLGLLKDRYADTVSATLPTFAIEVGETPERIRRSAKSPDAGTKQIFNKYLLRDGNLDHRIALLNRIDDIETRRDLTEHRVLTVEVRARYMGEKKLAAIRVRPGIGH